METTNNKGFTLIELLVVVSIIGLLASIILSSLSSARAKARDSVRVQSLLQLRNALEMYRLDHGNYPDTGGSWDSDSILPNLLTSVLSPLVDGHYISKLPDSSDPVNIIYYESQMPALSNVYGTCGGATNVPYVIMFASETKLNFTQWSTYPHYYCITSQ